MKKLLALITSLSLLMSVAGTAMANPPVDKGAHGHGPKSDNFKDPLNQKQARLKQKAQDMVLKGQATPKGKNQVVRVAKGQYVELGFEGEDNLFTLVAEFGDETATHTHGGQSVNHGGAPGPVHNQIPEPDRSVDNTTIWTEDFNQQHYQDLLYSRDTNPSMANFYLEQSSGKYTVDGYVSDWLQVPYNEASYGADYCGDIVCQDTWKFIGDQIQAWYQSQIDAGKTDAELNDFLAQFDQWDRFDWDGDGNFDEPDGYIDHFQSVHAGQGEETGGGAEGTDAIWSHRWAVQTGFGTVGPSFFPIGGVRIGNTNFYVRDYTVEPENGGVGVFSHEFAHDLGLPDEYDTSGNTGGAENSTAWWTIMSQGSYGTQTDDLGSAPIHFNAWDKFQLGFLDNYAVAVAGKTQSVRLGPAETNTKQPQALFVILPEKQVPLELGPAFAGTSYYYSGSGDNLDNTMTKSVTLPADAAALTAKVKFDIEKDWDYAYVTVNGDPVHTNLSTNTNPNGQNFGEGITGNSGGNWVDLSADVSAFAGQTVEIGFRYWTDVAATYPGFMADEVSIPGQPVDGAEADAGWTFDGFRSTTGHETLLFPNYYVAEYRQYRGYDVGLETGPYNFGWLNDPDKQNLVEHFPYQDGLLVWYWDTSYTDNNVGDHPGEGEILPVDAHPKIETWSDGTQMRPRLQSYDASFGLEPTDSITVHNNGVPTTIASKPAVPVFDDTKDWWVAGDPSDAPGTGRYQAEWNSVNVPKTGTTIRVVGVSAQGSFMNLKVN